MVELPYDLDPPGRQIPSNRPLQRWSQVEELVAKHEDLASCLTNTAKMNTTTSTAPRESMTLAKRKVSRKSAATRLRPRLCRLARIRGTRQRFNFFTPAAVCAVVWPITVML